MDINAASVSELPQFTIPQVFFDTYLSTILKGGAGQGEAGRARQGECGATDSSRFAIKPCCFSYINFIINHLNNKLKEEILRQTFVF